MTIERTCSLCSQEVLTHPISDGARVFCCAGCQAVFNILSVKNQLADYHSHPLFQQAIRCGLVSNPSLLDSIRKNQPALADAEIQKLYLEIGDLWCPSCADIIRLILLKERGVRQCVVDYATDLACIEFSPRFLSKEKIYQIIESLGYRPVSLESSEQQAVGLDLYLRFIIATFCALNVMMMSYPLYATYFNYDGEGYGTLFAWLSLWISFPVLGYSAQPIIKRFFAGLQAGYLGMETLVLIGVSAAFGLSLYNLVNGGTKV
jgi:Cu2+-exporting ATPase